MDEYEFVVDAMLGDLAKWLRILGKSTYYDPNALDDTLVEVAEREGAILATRDRELYEKASKRGVEVIYLAGLKLAEALQLIEARYGVRLSVDFSNTRCPLCNGKLRRASCSEVEGRVPLGVLERRKPVFICVSCGHVYWPGSHLKRMKAFLRKLRSGDNAFSVPRSGA